MAPRLNLIFWANTIFNIATCVANVRLSPPPQPCTTRHSCDGILRDKHSRGATSRGPYVLQQTGMGGDVLRSGRRAGWRRFNGRAPGQGGGQSATRPGERRCSIVWGNGGDVGRCIWRLFVAARVVKLGGAERQEHRPKCNQFWSSSRDNPRCVLRKLIETEYLSDTLAVLFSYYKRYTF